MAPELYRHDSGASFRVVASPGLEWLAATDGSGLLVLARGKGRARPMVAALVHAVESAVAASFAERAADGLPATVAAVVRLLRAVDQDLRHAAGDRAGEPAGDAAIDSAGIEALIAIAVEGRIFLIAAGGGARCERWRDGRWETLAPMGDRARPALGMGARGLIEVTSEPLRDGDLVAVLEDAGGGRTMGEDRARQAIASWAARGESIVSAVAFNAAWAALLRGGIPEDIAQASGEAWDRDSHSIARADSMATDSIASRDSIASGDAIASADPEAGTENTVDADNEPAPATAPWIDLSQYAAISRPRRARYWLGRVAAALIAGAVGVGAVVGWRELGQLRTNRPSKAAPGAVQPTIAASSPLAGDFTADLGRALTTDEHGDLLPPDPAHPPGAGTDVPLDGASNAPLATGTGGISIRTEPLVPAIELFLDDRPVGRAPLVLDGISAGRHRVRYEGPEGYHWDEEVMVREGEVAQAMAPIDQGEELAEVTVRSSILTAGGLDEEEGDQVLVDGALQGKTPIDLSLSSGVHAITVKREGMPPFHRVVNLRRSDRFILDVRVDEPPPLTLEHKPPSAMQAGETVLLTTTCRGLEPGSRLELYLHYAIDEVWDRLPMGEVPGTLDTYVIGLPIDPASAGKKLRYYFWTPGEGGEDPAYSPLFSAKLR